MIKFSIAFQSNKTPSEYEALAELVDQFGFDVVSVYNDLLFQPALGPLMLMARKLRRAQIGFAALNPYTVHPVEIAGQIAMLDLVSEGRAYLGLVRGAWLDQIGVDSRQPVQTLREAAAVVQHLLAGKTDGYAGHIFSLAAGVKLNYAPYRAKVPLMIGTWGKQTARLAGEIADEVKIGGSANPAVVGWLRQFIAQGEQAAGKSIGSVGVCLGAVTVVDDDRDAARAWVRREAALYLPVVAPLDPTFNDPEWLARVMALDAQKDYAGISRLISDDILDRFAFAGNAHDIIAHVERLMAGGCTRVEFGTPHGLVAERGIRLLGEKVLPHFAHNRV
ncbi:MAG: LLM class flavin-dependent oxidoreductase [Anaerolineae bacterium]|nr:LLM class flavin-dependent oxidoreductase [Anaerolineae bacterium]